MGAIVKKKIGPVEDSMDVFKKRNQTFPENLQGFCLSQAPYQQAEGE